VPEAVITCCVTKLWLLWQMMRTTGRSVSLFRHDSRTTLLRTEAVQLRRGCQVRARVRSSAICALGQVFSDYFGFPCHSFHRLLHTHHHPSSIIQVSSGRRTVSPRPHPKKVTKKLLAIDPGSLLRDAAIYQPIV
jgi:hypothetical protein